MGFLGCFAQRRKGAKKRDEECGDEGIRGLIDPYDIKLA